MCATCHTNGRSERNRRDEKRDRPGLRSLKVYAYTSALYDRVNQARGRRGSHLEGVVVEGINILDEPRLSTVRQAYAIEGATEGVLACGSV